MLGKTSLSAIRSLVLLAQQPKEDDCWPPRRIAEALGESPTYLAKVTRHMVKAGILEAEKGVKGGVRLRRAPAEITLLAVVEACQGTIVGDYCKSARPEPSYCNFHRAALELHAAITGVLGRWTLAHLLEKPFSSGKLTGGVTCLMGALSLHAINSRPAARKGAVS
ncbi:MAG: Rrf2 family transcriptional regulator [Bryobacterales bacterium]|nr:Rrf2 family transcriptional regulator [Bryobacterales bacterium]